jgi:hypothetical protein
MRHEIGLPRYDTGQRVPDPNSRVGQAEIALHAAWDKAQDAAPGQPATEAASACLDAFKAFREALVEHLKKQAENSPPVVRNADSDSEAEQQAAAAPR